MEKEREKVSLIGKKLAFFPLHLLQPCDKLAYIDLRYNNIMTIPSQIAKFSSLEWLDLSHNSLICLPAEIGQLLYLEELKLSVNKLTTLPSEIGNLSSLNTLCVYENQLSTIPSEIGNLLNLRDVSFGMNQLTTLPPEIGNLLKLKILCVEYNQLTGLPSELEKLSNITQLRVCGNKLTHIPSGIKQLDPITLITIDDFPYILPTTKRERGVATLYDLCCEFVGAHVVDETQVPIDIVNKLNGEKSRCHKCDKVIYSKNRSIETFWSEKWCDAQVTFGCKMCISCMKIK